LKIKKYSEEETVTMILGKRHGATDYGKKPTQPSLPSLAGCLP
jgi:hypothetical protein